MLGGVSAYLTSSDAVLLAAHWVCSKFNAFGAHKYYLIIKWLRVK